MPVCLRSGQWDVKQNWYVKFLRSTLGREDRPSPLPPAYWNADATAQLNHSAVPDHEAEGGC